MPLIRRVVLAALVVGAACGRTGAIDAPASGAAGTGAATIDGDCDEFRMPNPAGAGLPNAASYTDHGDGTVSDDVTGLVWEQAVEDARFTQEDAAARCAAKGSDWRLPTRLELLSLVDYTVPAPGPTINAIFAGTPGVGFWTSSPYAGDGGDEWAVGFDGGYSDYGVTNNPNHVRCVRAPVSTCHATRFEARDGLVVDHATGLTWQQTADPRELAWGDAMATCAALGGGWRAPSLTELQTIIDDTKEYPAADLQLFPDTPSVVFWTATPRAQDPGASWYVDFFYGATDTDVESRLYRVRCVR